MKIIDTKPVPSFRQHIASLLLTFSTAVYITLVFNHHILFMVASENIPFLLSDLLFLLSVFITLAAFLWLLIEIPSIGISRKLWPVALILLAAASSHARSTWNILYDENMIRNIIETDLDEARELLSLDWLAYIVLTGFLPALAISKTRLPAEHWNKMLVRKAVFVSGVFILLCLSILPFYDRYASLLRTHRHLRDMVIPGGLLHAGYKYLGHSLPQYHHALISTGIDARLSHILPPHKKTVLVIVVGETARTANFSLASYARTTNPLLEKRMAEQMDMAFYPQFIACGTNTSLSVPCMFSAAGRKDYNVDTAKYTENLLDVFIHAGFNVLWVDNNSGCKDVCARVQYHDLRDQPKRPGCNLYGCNDMALVEELDKALHHLKGNTVIVLHQKGSHGPSYFQHVPEASQIFQPTCQNSQLHECTRTEIINSYDNTILYTDTVLDRIITTLEQADATIIPAMFYASDHGESLGENNLYLHGMPWQIAPDHQKHVPALLWVSPRFSAEYSINVECLRKHSGNDYSHDNIFHTLTGLLRIDTVAYKRQLDIGEPCVPARAKTQAAASIPVIARAMV